MCPAEWKPEAEITGQDYPALSDQDLVRSSVGIRMRRIRKRMFYETLTRTVLLVAFWLVMNHLDRPGHGSLRVEGPVLLLLLVVVPGLLFRLKNYTEARRAVADMWALGEHSFADLSRM